MPKYIEFQQTLFDICDKETSGDSDNWTAENSLWAHCTVISLLVQDVFGGELLRASLEDTEFADMGSHYWNRLPDGTDVDFTASQFGDSYPENLETEIKKSDYVLSYPETRKRYELLSRRFLDRTKEN